MNLDDAVTCVQLYGPRTVPGIGRRRPAVVSQEVMIGWWHEGGVANRRARIEGLDGETVIFLRSDTGKRWPCPVRDLIYIRRWPEA